MRRRWTQAALAAATAAALLAPAGAQARTACVAETATPTNANAAQVSDAIFCLTNQIRAGYGLPLLRRDPRLDTAARLHSEDMAARGFFSHVNPDGQGTGARATAQGYTIGVGENIAKGQSSARSVMTAWMDSRGHCTNILSAARDFGAGTAVAGAPIYTQNFGDYFSAPVNQAPANGCPYTVDLGANVTPPPGGGSATMIALGALKLSPRRFRAGKKSAISFTLSNAASVKFRIERGASGRRVGGTCVRRTKSNRNKTSCTRYVLLAGKFTRAGVPGVNTVSFFGRLSGKRLKAGRYRLRVVATGESGSSPVKRTRFRILKP